MDQSSAASPVLSPSPASYLAALLIGSIAMVTLMLLWVVIIIIVRMRTMITLMVIWGDVDVYNDVYYEKMKSNMLWLFLAALHSAALPTQELDQVSA